MRQRSSQKKNCSSITKLRDRHLVKTNDIFLMARNYKWPAILDLGKRKARRRKVKWLDEKGKCYKLEDRIEGQRRMTENPKRGQGPLGAVPPVTSTMRNTLMVMMVVVVMMNNFRLDIWQLNPSK
jgi:hypothetical protein